MRKSVQRRGAASARLAINRVVYLQMVVFHMENLSALRVRLAVSGGAGLSWRMVVRALKTSNTKWVTISREPQWKKEYLSVVATNLEQ